MNPSSASALRVATSCVFGIAVVVSSRLRSDLAITSRDLETTGLRLLAYEAAGAVLVVVLALSAFSVGALLQRLVVRQDSRSIVGTADYVIACVLLGIAAIGLGMVALGFANLFYRPVAVGVACVLCAAVPFLWHEPRGTHSVQPEWPRGLCRDQLAFLAVYGAIVVSAFGLLVNRGLFPGEIDGDVWEHYLHYYELVLNSHGIWPNDVWYHFYLSKGAGMFFFATLLGDVFSIQAASMVAALLLALISFSFVRRATGEMLAGLVAAALVLASWNNLWGEAGSFLKHHTLIAALVVGVFWTVVEFVSRQRGTGALLLLTGMTVSLYLTFYVAVSAAFMIVGLAFLGGALFVMSQYRRRAWVPFAMGGMCVAGAVAAFVVNYLVTGLVLDSPAAVTWPFADKARFATIWSPLTLEYWFVIPQSAEGIPVALTSLVPKFSWWLRLLRSDYLGFVAIISTLLVIAGHAPSFASRGIRGSTLGEFSQPGWLWNIPRPLIMLTAFLSGCLFVGQIFPESASVFRLFAFALVFGISFLVVLLWWSLRWSAWPGDKWRGWVIAIFAVVGCFYYLQQTALERWVAVAKFVSGSASARDALRLTERSFGVYVPVDDMIDFRTRYPDGRRMMFLTYGPSPVYFVPTAVVSEPSYAFGNGYDDLLYGGPQKARKILEEEGIGYFLINLRLNLFLGLPYSELFSEGLINDYFGLAWSRGDTYVLGWRDEGVTARLPLRLLEVLQTKRTGDIPLDAEQRWGAELAGHLRRAPRTYDQYGAYFDWLYAAVEIRYPNASRHTPATW